MIHVMRVVTKHFLYAQNVTAPEHVTAVFVPIQGIQGGNGNGIGLCGTSPVASDVLWYQVIPHCQPQHYSPR